MSTGSRKVEGGATVRRYDTLVLENDVQPLVLALARTRKRLDDLRRDRSRTTAALATIADETAQVKRAICRIVDALQNLGYGVDGRRYAGDVDAAVKTRDDPEAADNRTEDGGGGDDGGDGARYGAVPPRGGEVEEAPSTDGVGTSGAGDATVSPAIESLEEGAKRERFEARATAARRDAGVVELAREVYDAFYRSTGTSWLPWSDSGEVSRRQWYDMAADLAGRLFGGGDRDHVRVPRREGVPGETELVGRYSQERVRAAGVDQESLGRAVRGAWLRWARRQPKAVVAEHPQWLVEWDELGREERQVDVEIGLEVEELVLSTLRHDGRG